MTDPDTDPIDPADGEALSAWLAGELPPAEAEELERRVAAEPALARRLVVLHDALVALRGLDTAEPPEGFDARLVERLGSEPVAEVVPLSRGTRGARPVAKSRRAPWGWLGAAAAGLVLLAGALSVPLLFGGQGGDEAALSGAPAGDAAEESETEAASEAAEEAGGAPPPRPTAPVIIDAPFSSAARVVTESPAPVPDSSVIPDAGGDAQAVGDRFLTVPEAVGLLGVPVEEARTIAAEFSAIVQDAPALSSGPRPGVCLDTVTQPVADRPSTVLVPVRVEAFMYQGAPALAYVLVGASTDAPALDRVELWVTEPVTCDTRIFVAR